MNIGIDIDDTLSDLNNLKWKFLTNYIKENKLPYKRVRYDTGNIVKAFNWTEKEAYGVWNEKSDDLLSSAPPRENASKILTKLKNEGNKIFIVTARQKEYHKDPYKLSKDWLDKNNIPYDKILVDSLDKLSVCKANNIKLLVDDRIQNLKHLTKNNIDAYLMVTQTNKHCQDKKIQKVYSWEDFYNKIKNI